MPSHSPATTQLLAYLEKAARRSHQARLDAQTLHDLKSFATYLVKVEGKGENTARVYKSLCAKALARGTDSNNKVMMSALEAFRRWGKFTP
jgi:hypothetical protein